MLGRPLTLCLAVALVLSKATSALASCMADLSMGAVAQMACCKQGHAKCPMAGTAEDCCKTDAEAQQPPTVATHQLDRGIFAPPALAVTISPIPFTADLFRASVLDPQRFVLKGLSPPPYLLTSALLI
jgi:hypothetical protein